MRTGGGGEGGGEGGGGGRLATKMNSHCKQ